MQRGGGSTAGVHAPWSQCLCPFHGGDQQGAKMHKRDVQG